MENKRSSGILLHPTSLPGNYGIGDLGQAAFEFVDFLVNAGQTLWQVMPLGPTGYGDSPYQCFSAMAGNPYLISLTALKRDGYLSEDDLQDSPDFPRHQVDYGPVIEYKMAKLHTAYQNYKSNGNGDAKKAVAAFAEKHQVWLEDYALFMAIKQAHEGAEWLKWDEDIRLGKPAAKKAWRKKLADSVDAHIFFQYLFFQQWTTVREYANEKGIRIIGDIPIFVALDSADVWSNRDLFFLDESGNPTFVAGVPPDYFSATGQLWGNPLYDWHKMEKNNFAWWIERIKMTMEMFDILRLDHFRGFEAYWRVPADEDTAMNGKWVKGPDAKLFKAIRDALGDVPIIAEDLGVITDKVRALRDKFDFPGMKVLQFAFGDDPENLDLPHMFDTPNCVVYTGTHDNNTTKGWYEDTSTAAERDKVRRYLGVDGYDISWDMIRLALMSIAEMAIIPMQDLLSLGTHARMNFPSKSEGNWAWRVLPHELADHVSNRLKDLTYLYSRNLPPELKKKKKDDADPTATV